MVGDVSHLSQESTSWIVNSVSQALALTSKEAICFPTPPRVEALSLVDEHCYLSIIKGAVPLANRQFSHFFLAFLHAC